MRLSTEQISVAAGNFNIMREFAHGLSVAFGAGRPGLAETLADAAAEEVTAQFRAELIVEGVDVADVDAEVARIVAAARGLREEAEARTRQDVVDDVIQFLGKNTGKVDKDHLPQLLAGRYPDLSIQELERATAAVVELMEAMVIEGLATVEPAGHA